MSVERVSPKRARDLVNEGYQLVDVRSVPEFEASHPAGAFNIPLLNAIPQRGLSPNPEFTAVFERHFAKTDKLVVSCKTGGRSLRAAELLSALGYVAIVDMRGGFEGERDVFGRTVETGWKECGLPVEQAAPGRSYEELSK